MVENMFPQDMTAAQLEIVNGVSLTRREIDIVACVLNGRTAKKTASLLFISPKTVENHIRNIMLKLGFSSQAAIIDWIENSDKFTFIKNHYVNILIGTSFEHQLRNLAPLIMEKSSSCLIIYAKANKEESILLSRLKRHLTLAGVTLSIEVGTEQLYADVELEARKNIDVVIFLLLENASLSSMPRAWLKPLCMIVSEHQSYYSLVFKILKKLMSDRVLDKYISDFTENSKNFILPIISEKSLKEKSMSHTINLRTYVNNRIVMVLKYFRTRKKPEMFCGIALLCLCVLFLITYLIIQNNKKYTGFSALLPLKKGVISEAFSLLAQIEAGKKPAWNLPRQDHVFVGRKTLLEDLSEKLQLNQKNDGTEDIDMLAISACAGLGGIGKTQLALQFAHHTKHPYILRAWFTAEDTDQLNQQYIAFAKSLGYEGDGHSINKVIAFVKQWLSYHPNWLLVYDNVNSYEEIATYIPEKGGHVLITTRSQVWPSNIQVLPIDLMSEEESIALVKHLTYRNLENKEVLETKELVKTLGYLPLALAQASAYIHQNQLTIAKYLALYKKHVQVLLADNTLPEGTKSLPVAATWNISLAAILRHAKHEHDPLLALDLLTVCAYLAPEEIPRSLLLAWLKETHPKISSPDLVLLKLIGELWRYSLIRVGETGNVTVHRLVQMVVREQHLKTEKLNYSKLTSQWYGALLKSAHGEFCRDANVLEDEVRKKNLLPHLLFLLKHYDSLWPENKSEPFLTRVIQDIGKTYDLFMGAFKIAKSYYQRVLEQEEILYGKDHPKVAIALMDLGTMYRNLRDFKTAKDFLEKALNISEQTLGKTHTQVADILTNLGNIHRNLKEFDKSRTCLERALKIQEQKYGHDHIQVAATLSTLSHTYTMFKEFEKAAELSEKALKMYENLYGKNHWAVAPTMVNAAAAYRGLADFKKSLEYLESALQIYLQKYGEDHIFIAITLSNLGQTYESMADFGKAQEYYERALKINEREHGKDHPQVATTLSVLGNISRQLKNFDKSMVLLERALKISLETNGKKHQETILVLESIATTCRDAGDIKKLEIYLKRISEAKKNKEV